jgi:SAM-dependent methyltransferase
MNIINSSGLKIFGDVIIVNVREREMDRSEWLREKRRETEELYTTIWAPLYGDQFGLYANTTHQHFMRRFLDLLPQPGRILDAGCGAGRYVPMLLEKGHTVLGMDQSQGMLTRLKTFFPALQVEKIGLQEMPYQDKFDGAICMDAMEHVCPEDWPLVLRNFHRALKPHAYLYFTVEIAEADEVQQAFTSAQAAGLPVVYGEWMNDDVYHYYPSIPQVKDWLRQAGFDLTLEGEGDGYHHLIVHKPST